MITGKDSKIVDGYLPYFIGMFMSGGAFVGGMVFGLLVHPIGIVITLGGIIGLYTIFVTSNDYILKQHTKNDQI